MSMERKHAKYWVAGLLAILSVVALLLGQAPLANELGVESMSLGGKILTVVKLTLL